MKGLTLVEVLIAMGIAAIVGVLLLAVIVNSTGLFYQQSSEVEQGLNINDALLQIRQNIKQSAGIDPTSTSGELVLKISSIDSSGNIIADTFDKFVFSKDQTKLRFKTFPDAASSRSAQNQIFSTNLDNLKFQYFDNVSPPNEVTPPTAASKVRITLTLRQKSGAGYETQTATTEASLRND